MSGTRGKMNGPRENARRPFPPFVPGIGCRERERIGRGGQRRRIISDEIAGIRFRGSG